jgi:hypothetical protein
MEIDTAFMLFCLYVCRTEIQIFDAYRNSFLRVISVIIEIINYPFKLGKMRFNRPFFFQYYVT